MLQQSFNRATLASIGGVIAVSGAANASTPRPIERIIYKAEAAYLADHATLSDVKACSALVGARLSGGSDADGGDLLSSLSSQAEVWRMALTVGIFDVSYDNLEALDEKTVADLIAVVETAPEDMTLSQKKLLLDHDLPAMVHDIDLLEQRYSIQCDGLMRAAAEYGVSLRRQRS